MFMDIFIFQIIARITQEALTMLLMMIIRSLVFLKYDWGVAAATTFGTIDTLLALFRGVKIVDNGNKNKKHMEVRYVKDYKVNLILLVSALLLVLSRFTIPIWIRFKEPILPQRDNWTSGTEHSLNVTGKFTKTGQVEDLKTVFNILKLEVEQACREDKSCKTLLATGIRPSVRLTKAVPLLTTGTYVNVVLPKSLYQSGTLKLKPTGDLQSLMIKGHSYMNNGLGLRDSYYVIEDDNASYMIVSPLGKLDGKWAHNITTLTKNRWKQSSEKESGKILVHHGSKTDTEVKTFTYDSCGDTRITKLRTQEEKDAKEVLEDYIRRIKELKADTNITLSGVNSLDDFLNNKQEDKKENNDRALDATSFKSFLHYVRANGPDGNTRIQVKAYTMSNRDINIEKCSLSFDVMTADIDIVTMARKSFENNYVSDPLFVHRAYAFDYIRESRAEIQQLKNPESYINTYLLSTSYATDSDEKLALEIDYNDVKMVYNWTWIETLFVILCIVGALIAVLSKKYFLFPGMLDNPYITVLNTTVRGATSCIGQGPLVLSGDLVVDRVEKHIGVALAGNEIVSKDGDIEIACMVRSRYPDLHEYKGRVNKISLSHEIYDVISE